jgi:hypothetical protein
VARLQPFLAAHGRLLPTQDAAHKANAMKLIGTGQRTQLLNPAGCYSDRIYRNSHMVCDSQPAHYATTVWFVIPSRQLCKKAAMLGALLAGVW